MAGTDFINDTGNNTQEVDADEVNANFDFIQGDLKPISTAWAYVDATNDLGSSSYRWKSLYCSDYSVGTIADVIMLGFI